MVTREAPDIFVTQSGPVYTENIEQMLGYVPLIVLFKVMT